MSKNKIKGDWPFSVVTIMFPLLVALLTPLIVYGVSAGDGDVFLYGKKIMIYIAMGFGLFAILCLKLLNRKIWYYNKFLIFGGIFLLGSFIAAFCAKDIGVAFYGGNGMFQGFWVLLGYFVLFYYAYILFAGEQKRREQTVTFLFRVIMVLALIIGVISVLQAVGQNPFEWSWVQSLCNMKGAKVGSGVYATLYNPNYLGVMDVMLIPLLVAGFIIEKQKLMRIIYVSSICFDTIGLVQSESKAGMGTLLILAVIVCVYVILRGGNYRKWGVIGIVLALALGGTLVAVNMGAAKNARSAKTQTKSEAAKSADKTLTKFETKKDCLIIGINSKDVRVTWDAEDIHTDGPLDVKYYPKKLRVGRKLLTGYAFEIDSVPYFVTNMNSVKGYEYLNTRGEIVQAISSSDAFPKSWYGAGSNRLYIWSKTIPLLPKRLLLGCGMDHFVWDFPNDDYASKAMISQVDTVYNRPHSFYLQMATETGVVFALCLLVMIAWILKNAWSFLAGENSMMRAKQMASDKNNMAGSVTYVAIAGLALAVLGYLIAGVVNDAVLPTAPVMWICLGSMAGLCYDNK